MKKTTIIAVIIGICAMILAACGTKDKGNPEEILGVWSRTGQEATYTFSFFKDGTCEYDDYKTRFKFGTWSYSKGEYAIHLNDMNEANTTTDGFGYINENGEFVTWTTDKSKAVVYHRELPKTREQAAEFIEAELGNDKNARISESTYYSVMVPVVGTWSDGINHLSIRETAGSLVWYNGSVDPDTYEYHPGAWYYPGYGTPEFVVILYSSGRREHYICEWDGDTDTLSLYMESAPTIKTVYHREG